MEAELLILIVSAIVSTGIWICFYLILNANGQLKMLEQNQNVFGFIIALITTVICIFLTTLILWLILMIGFDY